jgi:hypothetical protein
VVFPGVKLNEVERFDADVRKAFLDVLDEVVGRIAMVE